MSLLCRRLKGIGRVAAAFWVPADVHAVRAPRRAFGGATRRWTVGPGPRDVASAVHTRSESDGTTPTPVRYAAHAHLANDVAGRRGEAGRLAAVSLPTSRRAEQGTWPWPRAPNMPIATERRADRSARSPPSMPGRDCRERQAVRSPRRPMARALDSRPPGGSGIDAGRHGTASVSGPGAANLPRRCRQRAMPRELVPAAMSWCFDTPTAAKGRWP